MAPNQWDESQYRDLSGVRTSPVTVVFIFHISCISYLPPNYSGDCSFIFPNCTLCNFLNRTKYFVRLKSGTQKVGNHCYSSSNFVVNYYHYLWAALDERGPGVAAGGCPWIPKKTVKYVDRVPHFSYFTKRPF